MNKRLVGSVAKWVKASFLQQPWLDFLGSTCTLVALLCPWIRRFTKITSAWWLRKSSKFRKRDSKKFRETVGHWKLQAGADSSNHEVAITMKSARIVQYFASGAIW